MKKRLLTALAVTLGIYAHAQTEKGKIILGGTVSFTSDKYELEYERKTTSLAIGPSIGFFTSKNLALGLTLSYNYQKNSPYQQINAINGSIHIDEVGGNKSNGFGVIPFLRYYLDLHEKVKLFGQLNAGMLFAKNKQIAAGGSIMDNSKITTYIGSVEPGIAFFPHKKIAIELKVPLFSYYDQKYKYLDPYTTSSKYTHFSFGSDLTKPSLGVNFHL